MPEKFVYVDNRDDFTGWAFIAALTAKDLVTKAFHSTYTAGSAVDIELKFNGVEVSFLHILDRLREEYDRQVEKAAEKLIDDKLGNLSSLLIDFQEQIKERFDDVFGAKP